MREQGSVHLSSGNLQENCRLEDIGIHGMIKLKHLIKGRCEDDRYICLETGKNCSEQGDEHFVSIKCENWISNC
jgi:hypothetical protein